MCKSVVLPPPTGPPIAKILLCSICKLILDEIEVLSLSTTVLIIYFKRFSHPSSVINMTSSILIPIYSYSIQIPGSLINIIPSFNSVS